MAVVVKLGNKYRLYVKGALELVLSAPTRLLDDQLNEISLSKDARVQLDTIITTCASRSLRTICLA